MSIFGICRNSATVRLPRGASFTAGRNESSPGHPSVCLLRSMWSRRLSERRYDVAVVGSGFAGSLIAAIAQRLGCSVVLLERGKHPRFAIGESSTPLANLLLEDLSTRYRLPELKSLSKWGPWQRRHPEVSCGLKRGFSFYHHTLGEPAATGPDRAKQLLVAASPHNEIADTHWYRADFDEVFVQEAQKTGVTYLDEVQLHPFPSRTMRPDLTEQKTATS